MNSSVFSTGALSAPRAQASLGRPGSNLAAARYKSAQPRPHSTRVTTQVKKQASGFSWKAKAVSPPVPLTALTKLVMPKTKPSHAPPSGPASMAPMATGTVSRLIVSGPTRR